MNKKELCRFNKTTLKALPTRPKPYFVYDLDGNGLRIRISPTGAKSFQVLKRIDTKTKFVTLGKFCNAGGLMQMHPEQAQKQARLVYSELAAGVDVNQQKAEKRKEEVRKQSETLGHFIDNYYAPWSKQHHKSSKGTLQTISHHFSKWFDTPMSEITALMVENWRKEQLAKGRKPSGINRKVTTLRGIFSRAIDWEIIEHHPLKKLKQLKTDKKKTPRFLSNDEENRLRQALDQREKEKRSKRISYNRWCSERNREGRQELSGEFVDYLKPMILTALNTGLRRGELFDLTWHQIDLSRRQLHVVGEGAKSGQTRYIPLNEEACSILTHWKKQNTESHLVFPSTATGERLDNIQTSWENLVQMAELEYPVNHPLHFTFHDLRHTFASQLVMKGANLYDVKELLGHESIETTQIYAHLAPEHKALVVALLNNKNG